MSDKKLLTRTSIKKFQNEYGWSDYFIAKKAGLAQGTVSNILKRNTMPCIDTLEAICVRAFGITLSQFFADNHMIEITPELEELFANWAKLSEEKKTMITNFIELLAE